MSIRIAALALATVLPAFASAADWPQWRGPARDGRSAESVWPAAWAGGAPAVVWSAKVGTGFSSIVVSKGRAVTMGHSGGEDAISCFDARSGERLWRHAYASELGDNLYEGGPVSTPTFDPSGDRLYSLSKWGIVHCLDAAKGGVVWKRDLAAEEGIKANEWGLAGAPLVHGELIILNAGTHGTALDRRSGRTVWTTGKNATGYASPLLVDGRVLIFAAKSLVAVDPASGKSLWHHPFETGYENNNADPLIHAERIVLTSYDRGMVCLDVRSPGAPKLVYDRKRALHTHMAPPVVVGEHIYGFSGHHGRRADFRCVRFADGEVAWTERGPAAGSVMTAGEKLLILDGKGELIIAEPDPKAFKPLARARIVSGRCWTPPALANGLLYARNSRGELTCWDLKTKGAKKEAHGASK